MSGVRRAPPGYAAGAPLPWWAKFAAKLVLAPVPPRLRRVVGIGRHSFLALDPSHLIETPINHAARSAEAAGRAPRSVLEVGPGRMVARAPVWAALCEGAVWFADAEDDAPREPAAYLAAAEGARARGLAPPAWPDGASHEAILAACRARLLIGQGALAAIPPGSVDLIVADVVLEHVRADLLAPLLAALRRAAAPGALARFGVDFHDHFGGALRQLRFAPGFWESRWVGRSGLYTNRIGLSGMLAAMREAGFVASVTERVEWDAPPPGAAAQHGSLRREAADDLVAFAMIEARAPG